MKNQTQNEVQRDANEMMLWFTTILFALIMVYQAVWNHNYKAKAEKESFSKDSTISYIQAHYSVIAAQENRVNDSLCNFIDTPVEYKFLPHDNNN